MHYPVNKEYTELISKKRIVLILLNLVFVSTALITIQNRIIVFDNNYNATLLSYTVNRSKYMAACSGNKINIYLDSGKILSQYELENEVVLSCAISDLDKDGRDEIILLTSKEAKQYGDNLLVLACKDYEANNDGKANMILKEIYRNHCEDLNPWKVQTSDVDGDGKTEISIGVYKTSPLHPVMAKRPFIYDWVNGGIFPKWRGSRLSRPFDDYVFLDLDKDGTDEIVSIEHTSSDDRVLTSYSWKGFGFDKTGESISFTDISSIQVELYNGEKTNSIKARVKEGTNWLNKSFYYLDGKIIMKEEGIF